MNNLYIITGPAGVGKSTISYQIAKSKTKSALIEGDNIEIYLKNGYDVIFNYIVTPHSFNIIKEKFKKYNVKFIILMCDEKTILKRDNERIEACRMKERCIKLLNNFKEYKFEERYYLDTTDFTIEEIIDKIEKDRKFLIK